jgi:hypothetical protein
MGKLPCVPRELLVTFEGAIDSHGLANVIDALAEICAEKADHIRENWQDGQTAGPWSRMSERLRAAEISAAKEGI